MADKGMIKPFAADKLVYHTRIVHQSNLGIRRKGDDDIQRRREQRVAGLVHTAMEDARIPPHFRKANFEATEFLGPLRIDDGNRLAHGLCKRLAEEWTPGHKGLTLTGRSGVGKTYLAFATLCSIIRRHGRDVNARYITEQELLRYYRDSFSRTEGQTDVPSTTQLRKWFVERPQFLVLDDLGAEPVSTRGEWARGQIMELLEHRWRMQKTTFVTTNLSVDELTDRYDERIVSRLYGRCPLISIAGSDHRQQVLPDSEDPFWDPNFTDDGRPKATR